MVDVQKIIENGYSNVVSSVSDIVDSVTPTQLAIGTAIGGAVVGGAIVGTVASITKRKATKRKTSKKSVKKRKSTKKRKLKFGSPAYRKKYLGKHKRRKQRQPYTVGKRRDTSHKRIRFTKNNQPYIILTSGKARFIKKSSVKRSRKMKGGKY
jgi:ribulose kinase